MVVDDEAPLLKLMQAFLGKVGYTVEPFVKATEALETFRERGADFQILVADLTMPDISGEVLAIEAARINTSVKVLLCSGYPFDVQAIPADLRDRFATLQKPFLPKMLTQSIEDLLKRPLA